MIASALAVAGIYLILGVCFVLFEADMTNSIGEGCDMEPAMVATLLFLWPVFLPLFLFHLFCLHRNDRANPPVRRDYQ